MNRNYYNKYKNLSIKIAVAILGYGLLINVSYAQLPNAQGVSISPVASMQPDSFQLDLAQDVAAQLMSFEDIYKIAISFSPLVKYQDVLAVSQHAAYRLSKLEILNRITGFVNYSSGNQAIISNNINNGDALGQITNGYRTGVNAQISLHDLFGRPQQVRQSRAIYQASIVQKDIVKLQLKRELVTAYQDLITSQQVLKIRIGDEQTSFAAYQVAEIDARQGRKTPDELANSNTRYAQAKTIAEEAKGSFIKNAYYLEILTGVSIQELKRK